MQLLIIPNFKKRLLLFSCFFMSLLLIIFSAVILLNTNIRYTLTLNSSISLSYPTEIKITDVYSSSENSSPYLQTINGDYKKFIDFKVMDGNLEFSYPTIFEINKQDFPNSEIKYHLDLVNKKNKEKHGFIQVWNLPYSLEKFLNTSLENSLVNYSNFTSKKISVNNMQGYLWEYEITSSEKPLEKIKALEAFLSKDSVLYRFSYFMPLKEFNQEEYNMFWSIVKSIKTK